MISLWSLWTSVDTICDPKQGMPWFVRLATKLLREQTKGSESQWAPYIAVILQ